MVEMVLVIGILFNFDFLIGFVYYLMGFDIVSFILIFVMSRIIGWIVYIME